MDKFVGFGEALVKQGGTHVWVGDYGNHVIPNNLYLSTRFRNDGALDKRCRASYKTFMAWVEAEETKRKNTNGTT